MTAEGEIPRGRGAGTGPREGWLWLGRGCLPSTLDTDLMDPQQKDPSPLQGETRFWKQLSRASV